MRLNYAIKFVADMEKAISFHRDRLGLPLKFESPFGRNSRPEKRSSPFTRLHRRALQELSSWALEWTTSRTSMLAATNSASHSPNAD
jgi:hypothetical protein